MTASFDTYSFFLDSFGQFSEIIEGSIALEDARQFSHRKPEADENTCYSYGLENVSAQGIEIVHKKSGEVQVVIPPLASHDDVALGFEFLRNIKQELPGVKILCNGRPADLSEENETETYYYRLDNMARLIEQQNEHVSVGGISREFHIFPEYVKRHLNVDDPVEWTLQTFGEFIDMQWKYDDYATALPLYNTGNGKREVKAFVLTNRTCFCPNCQKILLRSDFIGGEEKLIDADVFLEAIEENPNFRRLDFAQFVMKGMPDEEWREFYASMKAESVRRPNTYIMRWNPSISSMTEQDYLNVASNYDTHFLNWSIHEYEKAQAGDDYFMVRVGDDVAGVAFYGTILSAPYEGSDWAGSRRRRRYVDISFKDLQENGEPDISIAELQEALPEVEWQRGHSGELLTEVQAERMKELFYANFNDEHDEDSPFDPDLSDSIYNECVDADVDSVCDAFRELFKSSSEVVAGVKAATIVSDHRRHIANVLQVKIGQGPLSGRALVEADEETILDLLSLVPFAETDAVVPLKLRHIQEFTNCNEAILTCQYEPTGSQISFYDTDYALNKYNYTISATYHFALAAWALKAEKVADEQMEIPMPESMRESFSANASEGGEETVVDPADTISLEYLTICLPVSRHNPDIFHLFSPVRSEATKETLLGRDFYRMQISIVHDEENDLGLQIPLIAKTQFFSDVPKPGMSVNGVIWLQGRLTK